MTILIQLQVVYDSWSKGRIPIHLHMGIAVKFELSVSSLYFSFP